MFRNLKEFSLPAVEEKVLAYWRTNDIFAKSLQKREPASAKASVGRGKKFVFYEGPPTANGRPGIHHVLARAFKDIVLRYKTMRGFHVPRRGGWDTHGLPVEIEMEKVLGLKSKKEIEKFGIAAFNAKCKESVWKYKDEWEKLTERMGFWLDMQHPYITYENRYMESVWAIFKEIWKKKLLYQGHKVVPWCPRCGTALSSHELALGYETVEDTSVYVKFKVKKGQKIGKFTADDKTFIVSWTTTPWTLPGNVALAINPKTAYVKVKVGKEFFILAKERLSVVPEPYEIVGEMKGKDLIGVAYEPLFEIDAFKSNKSDRSNRAYKVYAADFVTTEDGTGVVHTAVMYGEDDYQLGIKVGLPAHHTVDEAGKFTKDVKGFAGLFVKAPETEKKIIAYLEKNGLLLRTEKYEHEYPFCWRCETPLLYYARDSWFIAMSKLRGKLLSENKKIHWVPAHLRDGRFGEWLREVKDWAISRSRYWGTPLPIWRCEKCGATEVIGSIPELEERQGKGRNRYLLVRHGEAENNVEKITVCWPEKKKSHLTLNGRVQVKKLADELIRRREKVDIIVSSDLTRTRETAEIIAAKLGMPKGKIIFDPRLRELQLGTFNYKPHEAYWAFFASSRDRVTNAPPGGETLNDLRARGRDFIESIEKSHRGKTILFVGHGDPLWMLRAVMEGWNERNFFSEEYRNFYPKKGAVAEVRFRRIPRDEKGSIDLHRPYVDDITFPCAKCSDSRAIASPRRSRDKGVMKRVPDIADVWFDSGAMPFAQAHYPFEGKTISYPADYIAEAIDQTRGWFYTLLAIGVLTGKGRPFKNVISVGHVLDKNGRKMSKSKGNVVDPWEMIKKYGVDTVRWYFYTVNPPGEPKKFDEAELGKTLRQFLMMVYNSYLFYETYAEKLSIINYQLPKDAHVLDRWVMARLEETKDAATKSLEAYEVGDAARAIETFAGDLSRWYIRRSRRRLQPARLNDISRSGGKLESDKDYRAASATLGYVLVELTKLMAPFTPFFAEALYQSLGSREWGVGSRKKGKIESVHLEGWPKVAKLGTSDKALIKEMEEVRKLASIGLAKRAEKGIKVRQPLASIEVRSMALKGKKELLAILADEVNVKKVVMNSKLKEEEFMLDATITHELLEEGWFRELVRTVQGMRQDAELTPKDTIVVYAEVPPELTHVIRSREKEFLREVNAKKVEFTKTHKHNVELQTKIGDWPAWLAVKRT